jgi:hypothetical protein
LDNCLTDAKANVGLVWLTMCHFRGATKMIDTATGELGAGFAQRKRGFVCGFATQGVALGWDESPRWGDGL